MKLLADATLPLIHEVLGQHFTVNTFDNEAQLKQLIKGHDILVCRATLQVDQALLENSAIQCVATATSGLDHIDQSYLKSRNIACLDAKGANAQAVADYVLATMAWLWKNQSIKGNQAGIIGYGAVGTAVFKRLEQVGYQVCCYDPPKELSDQHFKSASLEDLKQCDVLCLHASLHHEPPYPSYHLINSHFIKSLKKGIVIINACRGDIVCEQDLIDSQHPMTYCTDVFSNEPNINAKLVEKATLCTPHIAGHSVEAKQNAIHILHQKLIQYFKLEKPTPLQAKTSPPKLYCTSQHWQDDVLKRYDPFYESQTLKEATDLPHQFLTLRKMHQRHHFS